VVESPRIPEEAKPALTTALESRVQLVSDIQLQQVLDQETVTDELRERIIVAYRQERLRAFRGGMVFLIFTALVGLVLTTGLPNFKLVN